MSAVEIFACIYKTFICYFYLIFIMKIMGKREIGNISTFDIVVFFVISELFSLSLNDMSNSIWHSIIPISVIVILQVITAFITLKSQKLRNFMEGKPKYIIFKGEIDQEAMKKERYNISDLMLQLRMNDIQSPSEVEFALLENSGSLTIIKKKDCSVNIVDPLIQDGKINEEVIKKYNISKDFPIYHFDVYRLKDSDEFLEGVGTDYFYNGACLIEWGDEIIYDILPKNTIHIDIQKDNTNTNLRKFKIWRR